MKFSLYRKTHALGGCITVTLITADCRIGPTQLNPQQHQIQVNRVQHLRSHTEPNSNQPVVNAAMETRVVMDEGRYAAEPIDLINGIRQLYSLALEAEERCPRQTEETEEMRHAAMKLIQQKAQHIVDLTNRLNDLQYHPDILDDDEATQAIVSLNHKLDVWVKGTFRNPELLENLPRLKLVHVPYSPLPLETTDSSQRPQQKWAFIRTFVTSYLFYYLFDSYMVGLKSGHCG